MFDQTDTDSPDQRQPFSLSCVFFQLRRGQGGIVCQLCAGYNFARYDPRFYTQAPSTDSRMLMLRRSCKVLAHVTCHMFGIEHCVWFRCLMNGRTTLPNLTPGRCISAPWISVNFNGASGLMWLSATDAFGTSIGGQDLRMRRSGWTSGFDSSRQTTGAVIRVELAQQITRGWGYSNGGCGLRDHHLPPSRRASASAN